MDFYWFSLLKVIVAAGFFASAYFLYKAKFKKTSIVVSVIGLILFAYQPIKLTHVEQSERRINTYDTESTIQAIDTHETNEYSPNDNKDEINEILEK